MLAIDRILCPVDFSEPSARALEYALALAERLGAEVDVVHVFHFPTFAVEDDAVALLPLYLQEDLSQRLRERLEQLVIEKAGEGPKVTARVLEGVPYVEIIEAAKGRDLIVMGTHGRSGLSHLLLGSVAERVVRGSEVPVLTIRSAGSPLDALMERDLPSVATALFTNSDEITASRPGTPSRSRGVRAPVGDARRPWDPCFLFLAEIRKVIPAETCRRKPSGRRARERLRFRGP